jgi:hypothetical protein
MRIVLQLSRKAARQLRAPRTRAATSRPLAWVDRSITAVHSGTTDPLLESFFEIIMDDPDEASHLVQRLQQDPAVEAAYIKPDDEMPSM